MEVDKSGVHFYLQKLFSFLAFKMYSLQLSAQKELMKNCTFVWGEIFIIPLGPNTIHNTTQIVLYAMCSSRKYP